MTPDLEKARAFYGGLFGWKFQVGPKETHFYSMCQVDGRNVAGMGERPRDAPLPPAWSVYFEVDDIDAYAARVRKHGGHVGMGPMDVMDAGRLAFCSDPTGAHFGLWQSKQHHGAQRVNEPGSMTWHEVNTRDGARARDFYAAVFGLEPKKMEGMEYWTLHKGPDVVAGVYQTNGKEGTSAPAHWMSYFAVADTDATVKKATELGGKVLAPPMDTPYGRMAVVADPAGATFSVIKLAMPAQGK
ncbi:VOC family protein [Pyxidicoccus parkwayensis]|uniref:VOC family protein n=2 Tax=Pyxidicoccus parkwayensis TaxID=2813578 RepID=A0ABX7PDX7_9BACT|nr:VOC family protein [Pyxidicoccus parkwaysis]